jgi:hypothetical protein
MTTRLEHREPEATTITGRRRCLGVIHLDALPPVGDIRFQQPSGLPVLTMALAPASLEPGAADRQRWWTLHSRSLEIDRAQLVVFAYESGLVRPGWLA